MIDLQIERPIPMPRALVVNIGLKIRLMLVRLISAPGILIGLVLGRAGRHTHRNRFARRRHLFVCVDEEVIEIFDTN